MDERKELLIKSMEFCQETISRMARNSFHLKVWFLVATTTLFAFVEKTLTGESTYHVSISDVVWIFPMFIFPLLDAYYLKQERMFVDVYNEFQKSINGDSNIRPAFNLEPSLQQRAKYSLLNVAFSISIGWLYFPILSIFQALIIYHSQLKCPYFWMFVLPTFLLIMAKIFSKKNDHQKI